MKVKSKEQKVANASFAQMSEAEKTAQKLQLLNLLQKRPHTTDELKSLNHRFSAPLEVLRNEGWDIKSERLLGGKFRYTLLGKATEAQNARRAQIKAVNASQLTYADLKPVEHYLWFLDHPEEAQKAPNGPATALKKMRELVARAKAT